MPKFIYKIPFHPFLFGLYPILSLWIANYDAISAVEVFRSALITILFIIAGAILLRLARLTTGQVAGILSLSAVLFFSYGHGIYWLAELHNEGNELLSPITFTLLYMAAWAVGIFFVIRWMQSASFLHIFLNITTGLLILLLFFQIASNEFAFASLMRSGAFQKFEIDQRALPDKQQRGDLPDVYYIVLDGYGSEAALKQFLSFDNADFYNGLKNRGFYVAEESTSNYANTAPSLASSLNFQYLDELPEAVGSDSNNYRPLREIIQKNQVMEYFDRSGYTTVAFETGFSITEIKGADVYRTVQAGPNNFESMLLTNSLSLLWTRDLTSYQYRNRITAVLEQTGSLADIPSPKFVFAHVMAAHPPFVYGEDGEVRSRAAQVVTDTGGRDDLIEHRDAYQGQVRYINRFLLAMVDDILRSSPKEPVIIIQGDHGSGLYMNWQSAEETCFAERKSILNAYYFPGGKTEMLYPTITPVNSFRVVFNTYLGADLLLLEDRNYFSLFESPYRMIDVTNEEGLCP